MPYEIIDIDGTLTTTGDTPNLPMIQYVKEDEQQEGTDFIVVSARPISRLAETEKWLADQGVEYEEIHLNDFEGAGKGPNVGLAFKEAKYKTLIEKYGIGAPDGIDYVIDNDPEVIAMAKGLGLQAFTPEQHLQDEGHPDAADVADITASAGNQMGEIVATPLNLDPSPMRTSHKDIEVRNVTIGEFRLADTDGQKTFVGYATVTGKASDGLPFTEVIAPGAFKRTLSRVAAGERVVKFLHGHDESRMLASTASGRLSLTEDEVGLRVEAKLDPADPDAQAVISKLTNEAKAMGMSFGFTVPKGGDAWEGETRTLREINLFEVSILSGHQPAYPATLGLQAVRKVAESRLGIDAERLINTLESVKAGKSLSEDEVEVIDAVRSRLAPKRREIDPTVSAAMLKLAEMEGEIL
jgi:HK97 family phage prohead protease